MEDKLIPVLLVSANVGSIFEDPQELLKIWIKEFLMVISHCQPKFLALHCQEVGGKNYKESMRHVEDFVRVLMTSDELSQYNHMRIYLDEDFTCPEKFTALGSLYFIHSSLKDVQIWDFHGHRFLPVNGKEVHKGNIEHVSTKEKAKFPQDIFPESKWSRKGFIRTRWSINRTVFDLVNIHLFHDASNFIAMEEFPSKYSKTRQNALGYTLQRFSADPYDKVPFFIFGDFNFRLDTKGIVQKLTSQTVPVYVTSAKNGEVEKILYKDPINENKVVLTLEKKVFDLDRHEETFASNEKWLLEYDKELKVFEEELFEFEISFPPSYPYKEDTCSGNSYMRTRCPSWCDRILLSRSALSIVNMTPVDRAYPSVVYRLVGENVAMGDHKPVMLLFNLLPHTESCKDSISLHFRYKQREALSCSSAFLAYYKQSEVTSSVNQVKYIWYRGHFTDLSSKVSSVDAPFEDIHVPPATTDKIHLILPRISVTFPTTKTQTSFSRFIHVKHPGSPARIFRETTV